MLSKNNITHIIFILLLILLGSFLRINNLGYSEFQDDEKKAMLRLKENQSLYSFFMEQRKGPMQFIVTSTVLAFNPDMRNEFLLRIPFTLMNIASIIVFYLIIYKLTKSKLISFLGSILFLTNGFIVGFSRIAQYQNINILFSLLALYCFIILGNSTKESTDQKIHSTELILKRKKEDPKLNNKLLKYGVFGIFFWCISLLAHWDAVFITIPMIYYFILFIKRTDIKKEQKIHIVKNMLVMAIPILIYLIPYIYNQTINQANVEYFDKRVGISNYPWERHKFIFELYNPYLTIYILPILGIFSLLIFRKSWIYIIWFIFNLITIKYLMEKPGTHLYNYVIPLIFLASLGISAIYKIKVVFYIVIFIPLIISLSFMYYQSYYLFVDHKKEYPWEEKTILQTNILGIDKDIILKTKVYEDKEVLTFGFPHYRNWKAINNFMNMDNKDCRYITNEGKEISQIYVDNYYGLTSTMTCYYIVDIKRPFITRGNGVIFAKAVGKKPIYTYKDIESDETLVKIYKIMGNKY